MAEHEPCIGASNDWYTPPAIFDALGLTFDLDPCSPGADHWVPARKVYTIHDDGLKQIWEGLVWMNPPFGGRNGHVPWLRRFIQHGEGIALVRAYTSSAWFHDEVAPHAHALLFPRGKTKFVRGADMVTVRKDGSRVEHVAGSFGDSPGHGVVLLAMGDVATAALMQSGLGWAVFNTAAARAALKEEDRK